MMTSVCRQIAISEAAHSMLRDVRSHSKEWAGVHNCQSNPGRGVLLYAAALGWIELERSTPAIEWWAFRLTPQGALEIDPSTP